MTGVSTPERTARFLPTRDAGEGGRQHAEEALPGTRPAGALGGTSSLQDPGEELWVVYEHPANGTLSRSRQTGAWFQLCKLKSCRDLTRTWLRPLHA